MKAHIWLTLSKSGVVKMTKEKPTLDRHQRAVRIEVALPDKAFDPPPILDCSLDIPAEALSYPAEGELIEVNIWGTEP